MRDRKFSFSEIKRRFCDFKNTVSFITVGCDVLWGKHVEVNKWHVFIPVAMMRGGSRSGHKLKEKMMFSLFHV